MNTSGAIFELHDAAYRYPEVTALDGVSLAIAPGERVAVLGANGSGKSTLLRLLGGLYFPDRGEVRFEGAVLTENAFADERFAFDFRRRVALIFQNPDAQLFNPTVFDEIAFGPLQLRWPKPQIIERVHAAMRHMGIEGLKDRAPHRLSGGEKKRVALASVLILQPDVLLLDEPTAALDPQSQSQMIDFLAVNEGGKTVLTATHDLSIIVDIADRCIVLEAGRVVASGTPLEILADEPLLRRAHLLYGHRHRHASGVVHAHPHLPGGHHHHHPQANFMKTTRMKIEGMSCEGCVGSTQRALQRVDGVRAVSINLPLGQADIEHEETTTDAALLAAVTDAGYDARIEES